MTSLRFCLQLFVDDVTDAETSCCEGPSPHLQHPAEGAIGLWIALQGEAKLPPWLDDASQHALADDDGRWPDGIDALRVVVLGNHRSQLRRIVLVGHVVEAKAHWLLLCRSIRQWPEQQVVRLNDEEVFFGDVLEGCVVDELADPKRAVHDDEAVVALIAPATAQLPHDDGRNLVNQASGRAPCVLSSRVPPMSEQGLSAFSFLYVYAMRVCHS